MRNFNRKLLTVPLALALVYLAGCGSGGDGPAELAKKITKLSKGQASVRRHIVEKINIDYTMLETTEGLIAEHVEDPMLGEGWFLTLQKWECADLEPGESCGQGRGIPITYVIDEARVDTGSLRLSAPDEALGESGYRVEFICAKGAETCLDVAGAGGFGGYTPCKERQCDLLDAEIEDAVLDLARTKASFGFQSIECSGPDDCKRIAYDFRKMIDLASGRSFVSNSGDFEKAVAHIAKAADGAEYVEDPVDSTMRVVAGYSVQDKAERAAYQTESIRLDPDGRLHIELTVCTKSTAEACSDEAAWETKISHVSLPDVDPSNVAVFSFERMSIKGVTTEFSGMAVYGGCRGGESGCVVNEGVEAGGMPLFFPCKDQKSCDEASADFAGIASFAGTPAFAEWLGAHREKMLDATEIKNHKQAGEAVKRIAERFAGTVYFDEALDYAHAYGAELYEDQFLIIRNETCFWEPHCSDPEDIEKIDLSLNLVQLNAGTVHADELQPKEDSPKVRVECTVKSDCISGTSDDGEFFMTANFTPVPCNSLAACEETARDLRGLIKYAASRSEEKGPGEGELGKLAENIGKLSSGSAYIVSEGKGKPLYKGELVRVFAGGGNLFVGLEDCVIGKDTACKDPDIREEILQSANLSDIDPGGISTLIFNKEGVLISAAEAFFADDGSLGSNYVVLAPCKGDSACVSQNGLKVFKSLVLPCPDQSACNEIVALLKNASGGPGSQPAADTKGDAGKAFVIDSSPLGILRNATAGADIYLPVTGADVARLMRGNDVSQGAPNELVVRRRVCLALLRAGHERGNECSLDTLFREYDLEIDLTALNPASIKVRKDSQGKGERGVWLEANCRKGESCARVLKPEKPAYRALEIDTILNGFGESESAPIIRMPCVDEAACENAADALRSLIEGAGRAAPAKGTSKNVVASPDIDQRIVGVWVLTIPQQTGWTWELRANGTYIFVNDQTSFEGTYKAAGGLWSQKAVNFPSEDNGTYRFIDADTIEFSGRLGQSVWKRRR